MDQIQDDLKKIEEINDLKRGIEGREDLKIKIDIRMGIEEIVTRSEVEKKNDEEIQFPDKALSFAHGVGPL